MKIRMRYWKLFCGVGAAAIALYGGTGRANAQAAQKFIPGEVLVFCQPGTAQADVQAVGAVVNAVKIVPNNMKDVYDLFLPPANATIAGTTAAIAALKGNPHLRWVGPNKILTLHVNSVTPNDPRYGEMHPLPQVNMPQAWALQKGAKNVNLCDIDSGFAPLHEDLIGRYDLVNSYNWGDGNSNITAVSEDHGVSTSGIMIANTNNSIGVAAICWQNVLCIGEKIQSEATQSLSVAASLSAYADILTKYKTAHIVCVNMSYGGGGDPSDTTNPEYTGLKALADAGVLLFASAGNSSADDHQTLPAAFPFVTTVSAVNRNGALTYYSSFGKVDIAAPGGEQFTETDPNGYLVCKLGSGYAFEQGTSFSCPCVTGIATLLMSVPGVTPAKALAVLKSTANHNGLGALPDPKFGWGIVDAYNALVQVSSSTSIGVPIGIDPATGTSTSQGGTAPPPISTQKPLMSFSAFNIPTDSETFTIDPGPGQISFTATQLIQNVAADPSNPGTSYSATSPIANVSDVRLTGTTTGTNPQYTISFRYAFPIGQTGTHSVQIVGINPSNLQTITDTRSFTVAPHVFPVDSSGVAMVSFPYFEDAEDLASAQKAQRGALFGPTISLYRWFNVPTLLAGTSTTQLQGKYAIYGPGHTPSDPGNLDPNAALSPTQYVPTADGSNGANLSPLGTAYFMKTPAPLSFNSFGIDYSTTSFRLPLHEGWNMVGDPYLFAVDFNAMEIEQLSGVRETVQAAVDGNFLLPHVYHYANGDYTFESLPDGTLDPWAGQWLYVLPRSGGTALTDGVAGYLIVTPAAVAGSSKAAKALKSPIQRALSTLPAVSGAGSWAVQLAAHTGTLHDTYNFVGESSRATMGMDSTKVPKPPKVGAFVTLGVSHPALNMSGLAQDLQPIGGTRSWDVAVSTDQANAPVTVAWPNMATVPRNYKLVLTDTVTGQTVDLRNESSYQFTSGASNSTRAFTLTATPSLRGRTLVSNVTVNPGRAGGRAAGTTEIGYTVSADSKVDVSILGLNGRVVAQVSPSRAVSGGSNSVVWTGQDVSGHSVPAGSYILQIRAVGSTGELTRQIVPFTVSGR